MWQQEQELWSHGSTLSLTSSEILDKLLTLWNPIFLPVKWESQ